MPDMPSGSIFWVDGERAGRLSLPDRGLEFGDGLFETILVVQSSPVLLQLHQDRLAAGFSALGFRGSPPKLVDMLTPIKAHLSPAVRYAVRVTLTRAPSDRGYAPGGSEKHHIIVRLTEVEPPAASRASIGLSSIALASQPQLAGIKHLNRLEQVMAASERARLGVDEVLTCNQDGAPVAVSSGNLFIRKAQHLMTPTLAECGIAGTRRRLILEQLANDVGCSAREQDFSLAELRTADEVFYCNALIGIRGVERFKDQEWVSSPVADLLAQRYEEVLAA